MDRMPIDLPDDYGTDDGPSGGLIILVFGMIAGAASVLFYQFIWSLFT